MIRRLFPLLPGLLGAAEISPAQREFFETRIRPVLAQDCYECHRTGGKKKGGLALDHRAAMTEGGDSDDLFDFDKPEESFLIKVIRHEEEDLPMPKDGVKWNERIIGDFVKWIEMGAPDPRSEPPSDKAVARDRSWEQVRQRRQQWWSFQPVRAVTPPEGDGLIIDRFLNRKIAEAGLMKSPKAGDRVLVRRLSLALRGLPPTPEEVERYLAESRPDRWERLVDDFLASPRFGERWARHWMDWIRYADSHGSEGDPAIRNAWRYRDYLIRALNENVPYDTLVMEHLAGDLLEKPRIKDGRNESALGPAHLRMVYHGFAPTDALDEKVRFTDDQVNVVTKAFLGLTVSCARCHNHKFDAISQEDYYALFGIFGSTKPGVVRVDEVEERSTRERMTALKKKLRQGLAEHWAQTMPEWSGHFLSQQEELFPEGRQKNEFVFLRAWDEGRRNEEGFAPVELREAETVARWRGQELAEWTRHGEGLTGRTESGGFAIATDGASFLTAIHPAGLHSDGLSSKDRGVVLSPRIELEGGEEVWLKVRGRGNAVARYSVQNYPRNGTVFPANRLRDGKWRWIRHDLDYWKGDRIHLELTTSRDQPILAGNEDRSSFALAEALVVKKGGPSPADLERQRMKNFLAWQNRDEEGLPDFFRRLVREALQAWSDDQLTNPQALLLDELLQIGILPNKAAQGGDVLAEYRRLEESLAVPVRAPGVWEADSHPQEFFERGDHKKPAHLVKRRFLEAIDEEPYDSNGSGRLELARDFLRPDNPFTARVIVNRVWHHLFGAGLVKTPNNFGRLGEAPSHPELLDHLATQFVADGWDLKMLIRRLVLTGAWQRSSLPESRAREKDPDNRFLSYFTLRRLEAEAIRDTLLTVSGSLDDTAYGNPVDGRSRRRSVYVRNQRNRLDPFLQTFNAPVPLGGKGRRDETNVPAQSLTLLNSPWVMDLARDWAGRLVGDSMEDKVRHAYETAFARPPSRDEQEAVLVFLDRMKKERSALNEEREKLARQIEEREGTVASLEAVARSRVEPRDKPEKMGPRAMARWNFEEDARDQEGSLHGRLHGGAEIREGGLLVGRNQGYFTSEPLDHDLAEKTLQVLVRLDRLEQQGGGVLGIQTLDGHAFDTIVYAETEPGQWLAGSEFHRRTRSPGGPPENEAHREPVWITITYARDGTIRLYRNGEAYGKAHRPPGLTKFQKGEAQIIIGNRHGPPGAGRLLNGRIEEARLFDRALSEEEVALSIGMEMLPSRDEVRQKLTADERATLERVEADLEILRERRAEMKDGSPPSSPLADLAHALMNSKEMIYVR